VRRPAVAVIAALASALLLAGCTQQGAQVPNSGYVQGDGVDEWRHPTSQPVVFSGPTVDGARFRSADHRGQVLVVNFWYAGCGPCIAEAPDLRKVAAKYAGDGVQFVGVNIRDEAGEARPFEVRNHIPYPSILDQANGGAAQLAFASSIQPNAVPTTLVVDKSGRVTARVLGQVNVSVLSALIDAARTGRDA
jgi:thiol-disulfide isomerase/thioredoxin